ncbi:NADH:flavin oxidoreductase/NADH oxidase [Glacieibacterium sp.]|uniref:NADH:flavin oxidoreductase/NADH oxidase n=1 Tax=Glacieibacterium sp. TaxID=2860237 RepID=UPI003AFFDAB2
MSSKLFEGLTLGGLSLPNRIVIAPMCQYSAVDGNATDWHTIHLGSLALSGAGLLIIEASAVEPEGRISPDDLGLWSDDNEAALGKVLASVRRHFAMPIGIQLAHAGRKASVRVPWQGNAQIPADAPDGWQTVAPSAIAFDPSKEHAPEALDADGLSRIKAAFVAAAQRAERLGLDLIELHGAHGYLLHEFLSPLSNLRTDDYGGSLDNRMRFPLEVFEAVRAVFPAHKPVGMRVSASDWADGGWDIDQTIAFAKALEAQGCSFMHVSSAGLISTQKIAVSPSYQVPFARAVKAAVTMPVIAVGLITEYEQAEAIVATGDADAVALARGILYDPHWPWHAAAHLGAQVQAPNQYLRSQPQRFKSLLVPNPA